MTQWSLSDEQKKRGCVLDRCPVCEGKGLVIQKRGPVTFPEGCGQCDGTGEVVMEPIATIKWEAQDV